MQKAESSRKYQQLKPVKREKKRERERKKRDEKDQDENQEDADADAEADASDDDDADGGGSGSSENYIDYKYYPRISLKIESGYLKLVTYSFRESTLFVNSPTLIPSWIRW